MKKLKTLFVTMLIATLSFALITDDAYARGGGSRGGGGFRSSSRPSSRPASRPKSSPSKSSPSKSTEKKSWGGNKATKPTTGRTTAKPKMTAAQQKSLETAKKNGTAFKSKTAAQDAFKTKYASQYKSKYATKPATRPSHIPQTTKVGNTNVNVVYNQQYGGYGYMHPTLGTWMMYDVMTDMIMMNMLMNQHHYVVEQPVQHSTHVTVVRHRTSPFCVIASGFVVVLIIVGVVISVNKG